MKPTLVLFSDFGIDSGLVASMHGVCARVDPALPVYDATHLLPAFDVRAASFCLQYTVPYWPQGTVFVSVVDPGVGTDRRACVAELKNGCYVVTPDNGSLTYLDESIGVTQVRVIDEETNRYRGPEDVSVFHGRDLFAYCGAKLAAGVITYEQVGAAYPVDQIVRHPIHRAEIGAGYAKGVIESHDPFGTAETNFRNSAFDATGFRLGDLVDVTISLAGETCYHETVPFEKTFGAVPQGAPVLFRDLAFYISLGLNKASFVETYGLQDGKTYDIVLARG
ncbi:MAG: SAM-dependent chlorinase/fluorinase [Pseudoflavonifractor sp.]